MTLNRTANLSRRPNLQRAVFLLMLSALALPLAAQLPDAGSAAPAASIVPAASALMRPAITSLHAALEILRPERWKASGAITGESASDVSSIERDLDATLPPLLAAADAAPGSAAQLLPAYRNVEALYDVLVRVTQTAVLAAPAPQSTALQQATMALQQSRRDFGELLNSAAQSQERQLRDVQVRLRTMQAAPAPVAPVCPPPPVKKPKRRAKPLPKPSASPPAAPTAH
jgi:hypothetical protein